MLHHLPTGKLAAESIVAIAAPDYAKIKNAAVLNPQSKNADHVRKNLQMLLAVSPQIQSEFLLNLYAILADKIQD